MDTQPSKFLKTLAYAFGCFSGSRGLILSFQFSPLPILLQTVENITCWCAATCALLNTKHSQIAELIAC